MVGSLRRTNFQISCSTTPSPSARSLSRLSLIWSVSRESTTLREALWAIVSEKNHQHETSEAGTWFYQKVVLSRDPSQDGDYTAMIIHYDANWVSFARAKEGRWRSAAALDDRSHDRYADCVYHDGRFYTVTLRGVLEAWDLHGPQEPIKEVIIANGDKRRRRVLTRFLVSTPCGRLLQIRTLRRAHRSREIEVHVLEVDVRERKLVSLSSSTAFQDHAVFVGLNQSACLPTKKFPELKPNCVYFTSPRLMRDLIGLRWMAVVEVAELAGKDCGLMKA
nr:uncharacterized protein LOC127315460 [Lolium perenne]